MTIAERRAPCRVRSDIHRLCFDNLCISFSSLISQFAYLFVLILHQFAFVTPREPPYDGNLLHQFVELNLNFLGSFLFYFFIFMINHRFCIGS